MGIEENIKKHLPLVKKNLFSISIGILGLIFLGYGLIVLIAGGNSSSDEIIFESGKEQAASSSDSQIIVDVSGGVLGPGVYKLSPNARVQDALVAAQGLSDSADRAWISKNLNLALKLRDGAKIYIPRIGEDGKTSKVVKGTTGSAYNVYININTAGIKELDTLPGVGPVTAQRIIDSRPYGTIDDLLSKKVVNSRVFGEIKEKITVD